MNEESDARLLRAYAEFRNEDAFREIVARYTDLVYSAALRQVNAPDLAHDVAQSVFTDLARKAASLSETLDANASLLGWLYRSTRFAALTQLRDDRRREARERQVMDQFDSTPEHAPEWERVRPVLDEAMGELNEEDREALLLRFFKDWNFRAIGQSLGVSDDVAQKRVSRALEKLRAHLTSRGVTTSTAALAAVLSANAVTATPAGLAAAFSTTALAGAAVQTSAAIAATKAIAMTTVQKTIIGAALAAAVGTGIFEAQQASKLRARVEQLTQQQAPLAELVQLMQRERDEATNRLAGFLAEHDQLRSAQGENELLKLRGEIGMLRQQADEVMRLREESTRLRQENQQWQQPASPTTELVKEKQSYAQAWMRAFRSYAQRHQGQLPDSFEQAVPYWPPDVGQWPGQTPDQFEILYHGSLDLLTNADPNLEVVVFREKKLWQNVNGRWGRFDVLANGRAQYGSVPNGTADGEFSSYEKEHLAPVKSQ